MKLPDFYSDIIVARVQLLLDGRRSVNQYPSSLPRSCIKQIFKMIQIICGHIGNTENFSQTGNLSKDFDKRSPLGRSYHHFNEIILKKTVFVFMN